jgi:hypothetical protein
MPLVVISVPDVEAARLAIRLGKPCPHCVKSAWSGRRICLVCARKPDVRFN